MGALQQAVGVAVRAARDEAKHILTQLETRGHPQTNQSSALYLALVGIQKRVLAVDPPPASMAQTALDLEDVLRQCTGKLAPVQRLIAAALRLAQGGRA
jgi:hypothetical protein